MYPFLLVAGLTLSAPPTVAGRTLGEPAGRTIAGRVSDPAGAPLVGVRVSVLEARRSTSTDDSGRYRIAELPTAAYTVSFAAIGRRPVTRRVNLGSGDVTLDVVMVGAAVELEAVQVTATPGATDPLTSPQPLASLAGDALTSRQAASLGETLRGVPGVRNWSTGVGVGKPVIRGLSSTRVLVLDDGQRLETQQWGDEHGPDLETADAERIEVIRGPASVLYGSDALGGVVNVIRPDLPDAIGRAPFVRGRLSAAYGTNNRERDGALSLSGAAGAVGFRASLSGRASDDLRTPTYTVWNSGNQASGGGASVGARGSWGSLAASYTRRDEHVRITEENSAETPSQRINTDLGRVDLTLPVRLSRVEITLGWTRNRRREFEDSASREVALGLLQTSYTGEVHLHHPPLGRLAGIVGLSAGRSVFEKFGEETLIPNTTSNAAGVFLFERLELERWTLSAGVRYDLRNLDVDTDSVIGTLAQSRRYTSLTGNLGALFRLAEPAAIVLNVGRGFRAPSSFELFSNGVHEGTTSYEVGNPGLENETSFNADLVLRVRTGQLALELGGFINAIQRYIYSVPTGATDSASGFQIFDWTQGDARLVGAEASVQYHPWPALHLGLTADYVRGENTSTGNPLPNVPPLRATWTGRYEGRGGRTLRRPFIELTGETNARQSRLDPAEAQFYAEAFDGAGYRGRSYSVASLGGGFSVPAGRSELRLVMTARNLFNTAYAEQLDRLKTNAPNPGMGRSLVTRLSVDF
jgi:iron complex outermembrane receptor protein